MSREKNKNIVIIGAGDFGKEVAWLIERINNVNNTWNIVGYIDEKKELRNTRVYGYPVIGGLDWFDSLKQKVSVVCAIGDCNAKEKITKTVSDSKQVKLATLIDPATVIAGSVSIGEGSIVCAGVVITPDARIGNSVIINLNATIGHDTVVGNFCTIHPGSNISGKVIIGEKTFIGTGTKILQGKSICDGCTLGAGSVVNKDIKECGTYVGNPARGIRKNKV